MKFTYTWLQEHLDTTAPLNQIVDTLIALGLEVESVQNPAKIYANFIIGDVEKVERHPDADRLNVCLVQTGQQHVQVVCGASNVRAGMKGAFAPAGVLIPATQKKLKKGRIRGVDSFGMLCSAAELNMGADADGILDLQVDAPAGTPLAKALGLDDPTIEIAITPNRSDCFSIRGIARDLAAAGLGTLKPLSIKEKPGTFTSPIGVQIQDLKGCPYFVGRMIRNITNGPSPEWAQQRLQAVGLRPISALVDVTNYLCYHLGRPLHVYDAASLKGDIIVRTAKASEKLDALDEQTYTLEKEMIAITDESGVIGLGGIMGGTTTSCTESTTDVFIESALFDSIRIAQTGQALNILSDSRTRFERGVDWSLVESGVDLATQLILEWCAIDTTEVSKKVYAGAQPEKNQTLTLNQKDLDRLSGYEISLKTATQILEKLGFKPSTPAKASFKTASFHVPPWRHDLEGTPDLIEDVLRVQGYDQIPAVPLPSGQALDRPTPYTSLRKALAARGLSETLTWAFMDPTIAKKFGEITEEAYLANPISQDLAVMRPSVLPNLIQAVGRNAARGHESIRLFELGATYTPLKNGDSKTAPPTKAEGSLTQRTLLSGVRSGFTTPRHWSESQQPATLYDAKADVYHMLSEWGLRPESLPLQAMAPSYYHPGRSGSVLHGKKVLAYFGEIHPTLKTDLNIEGPLVAFEIFLENLPPLKRTKTTRPGLEISPYQMVKRDFAFLIPKDVPASVILETIQKRLARHRDFPAKEVDITQVRIFDVYQGDKIPQGQKSLAFSIRLQPKQQTLDDATITTITDLIALMITEATGGQLRTAS